MSISLTHIINNPHIKITGTGYYMGKNPHLLTEKGIEALDLNEHLETNLDILKHFITNLDNFFGDNTLFLSNVCSNSRYLTPVCDDIPKAFAILTIIKKTNGPITLIVDDVADIKSYRDFLQSNKFHVKTHLRLTDRVYLFLRNIKDSATSLRNLVTENFLFKKVKRNTIRELPNLNIVTWISTDNIDNESLFEKNRYFFKIPAYLSQKNNLGFLGHILKGNKAVKDVAKIASEKNLPIHFFKSCVTIKDSLCAWITSFRLILFNRKVTYQGVDYSAIIQKALKHDFLNGNLATTLIHYLSFKKMFRFLPPSATLIYPFENQPWEKALLLAAKESDKKIRCIAHQFFPFAKNFFIHTFSQASVSQGLLPDAFITSDALSDNLLKEQGFKTHLIGSVRYDLLLRNIPTPSDSNEHIVLCCLFLDPQEAIEMAFKAIAITEKLGVSLWINYHLMMPQDVLARIQHLAKDCPHVTFFDCPAIDLLKKASIVLYNSSTVCYDAALMDVPIVYVECSNLPNLDRFQSFGKRFKTLDEGERMINTLLNDEKHYQSYATELHNIARNILMPLTLEKLEAINA